MFLPREQKNAKTRDGIIMDEKIITDNKLKKEYLRNYRQHVKRISRIESELEEIRILKACPSAINNDGMPHGSGQKDLSDYAVMLDELEKELLEERYSRIKIYKDIAKRIKDLDSRNENEVMFYRYIKGLAFWEIAEKMEMSERWVLKLHGRALAHINISEEILNSSLQFTS